MAYNRIKRLEDNIAAIRTAFTVTNDGREPSEQEIATLNRYCGFGGLKCILWDLAQTDVSKLSGADKPLLPLVVELHDVIRRHSAGAAEYKARMDSLKSSLLTGFYTPDTVTEALGEALFNSRMRNLDILDPSAGLGAFSRMLSVYSPWRGSRISNRTL